MIDLSTASHDTHDTLISQEKTVDPDKSSGNDIEKIAGDAEAGPKRLESPRDVHGIKVRSYDM